jgi:hypothetical protein
VAVEPEHGVPVSDMLDELAVIQNLSNPNRWFGAFRSWPCLPAGGCDHAGLSSRTIKERRDQHHSGIDAGVVLAQVGKGAIGRSSSVIRAAYSR